MTYKRFTLVDDYKIGYDGDIFDLHKPSNVRSLVNVIGYVTDENEQLKKQLESEHTMLDNAILLERTRMGQNSLKQYKDAIQ